MQRRCGVHAGQVSGLQVMREGGATLRRVAKAQRFGPLIPKTSWDDPPNPACKQQSGMTQLAKA